MITCTSSEVCFKVDRKSVIEPAAYCVVFHMLHSVIIFIPYLYFSCTRQDNHHLIFFLSFVEEAPKDHRDMKLDSVRLRYSSEVFDRVSEVAVIGRDALLFALGGEKSADEWVKGGVNLRLRSQPYLIKSPSRKIDWLVVFFGFRAYLVGVFYRII